MKNKQHIFQQFNVTADSSGNLPTQIEVLRAGQWPESSNKGMLYITPVDLAMMKANFDAGIGVNPKLGQLPIDFMHNEWDKAAGWITDLEVSGDVLLASVTWTDSGSAALIGGDFKMFSPSFYPGCLGEWHDPEDWDISAPNVLVGGALTNIPFFKDLQPVMASNSSKEGDLKNIIFVDADAKGATMPTLEEVRVKDVSVLTEEEKTLLNEHKDELTQEEKVSFGLEAAPVAEEPKVEEPAKIEEPEAQAIAASLKAGTHVVMAAADVKAMNDKIDAATTQLADYHKKDVKTAVEAHHARGAIKSDQIDMWTAKIVADASVMELLKALPDGTALQASNGKGEEAGEVSAVEEVREKAKELVTAAKADGKELRLEDAYTQVMAANEDLKDRYNTEVRA